jgi:1,4-dihydroxy-2-naphthoyl-CoA synthase
LFAGSGELSCRKTNRGGAQGGEDRGDCINALSPEVLRQLTQAARSFEDDGETSVVVLAGHPRAFSAGFDKDAEGRSRRAMDLGALRQHLKLRPRLTRAWQEMEQITIGAIEGFCSGGGVLMERMQFDLLFRGSSGLEWTMRFGTIRPCRKTATGCVKRDCG